MPCPECPRHERAPWHVSGPRLAEGACEREQYRAPRERDHPGCLPHDVAAAPTGEVWFAGQKKGLAGRLDPELENVRSGIKWARHHDPHLETELVGTAWWYFAERAPRIITWNGKGFDLPVLRARSLQPSETLYQSR